MKKDVKLFTAPELIKLELLENYVQQLKEIIIKYKDKTDLKHLESIESLLNESKIDESYNYTIENGWLCQDIKQEFRTNYDEETNIPAPYSRHYETKSVAKKLKSGQWVGWTFWYGGGKHGDPESIDWIDDAYFLDCFEEEKLVTIKTFNKVK